MIGNEQRMKMMSVYRIVPRSQRVIVTGVYNSLLAGHPKYAVAGNVAGRSRFSDNAKSWKVENGMSCIEGFQGEVRELSVKEARHVLKQATEYQNEGPSIQGAQDRTGFSSTQTSYTDVHSPVLDNLNSHVSLYGCMQSNVPTPQMDSGSSSGYGSYLNMPGSGEKLLDKYLSNSNQSSHPSRQFSTSSRLFGSQQDAKFHMEDENEILSDPTPQGVQGDNCVDFKLWMETCQRYNLPNCDEQMEALKVGRKTLAQVFEEQHEIIMLVAESYRKKQVKAPLSESSDQSASGQKDYFHYNYEFEESSPCPQGLQGDDCATYKAWTRNCKAYGFTNCDESLRDVESGRKTLQDIFDQQSESIKKIVADYQQKRPYSTSSKQVDTKVDSSNETTPHSIPPSNNDGSNTNSLSSRQKLQRAVKEYGATVMVFHISMSLMSLGGFYVLVSR